MLRAFKISELPKMNFILYLFWATLMLSCKTEHNDVSGGSFDQPDTSVLISKIFISPNDSLILSRGSKIISYGIWNDSTFCFLEDCEHRLVRQYAFPSLTPIQSLPVPPEMEMCEGFHNYMFKGNSEYLVLTDKGDIFNYKNSTFQKIADIKNVNLNSQYEFTSWLMDHNQIFQKSDSSILIPISYNRSVKGQNPNKRPYNAAMIQLGKVYLLGDRTIPHWTEEYFGLIDKMYQYFTDSTIVYMFSQNAQIRVFNYISNQLFITTAKSTFQDSETAPVGKDDDKDVLWNHMKSSGHYERLVYDPWRHLYYRFFFLPIPAQQQDGTTSTIRDRQVSVMILDEKLNVIAEKLLPGKNQAIHMAIPTPSGLYINDGPIIASEGLKLFKITYEPH